MGDQGHVLDNSCLILVNFGRILHILVVYCIILLNVAVNFPNHHQKKMTVKNGLKMDKKKRSKNVPKMVPQKYLKMASKWPQNDAKMIPKWPKTVQKVM